MIYSSFALCRSKIPNKSVEANELIRFSHQVKVNMNKSSVERKKKTTYSENVNTESASSNKMNSVTLVRWSIAKIINSWFRHEGVEVSSEAKVKCGRNWTGDKQNKLKWHTSLNLHFQLKMRRALNTKR